MNYLLLCATVPLYFAIKRKEELVAILLCVFVSSISLVGLGVIIYITWNLKF